MTGPSEAIKSNDARFAYQGSIKAGINREEGL